MRQLYELTWQNLLNPNNDPNHQSADIRDMDPNMEAKTNKWKLFFVPFSPAGWKYSWFKHLFSTK